MDSSISLVSGKLFSFVPLTRKCEIDEKSDKMGPQVAKFGIFRMNPSSHIFTGESFPDFVGFTRKHRNQDVSYQRHNPGFNFYLRGPLLNTFITDATLLTLVKYEEYICISVH